MFLTYPLFWKEQYEFSVSAALFSMMCGLVFFIINLVTKSLFPSIYKKIEKKH